MSDLTSLSSPAESSLDWPEMTVSWLYRTGYLTCMGVLTEMVTFLHDVLGDLDPHVHGVHVWAISDCLVMIL